MKFFAVYIDSNPSNVKAFFRNYEDATIYGISLGIPYDVAETNLTNYVRTSYATVTII